MFDRKNGIPIYGDVCFLRQLYFLFLKDLSTNLDQKLPVHL